MTLLLAEYFLCNETASLKLVPSCLGRDQITRVHVQEMWSTVESLQLPPCQVSDIGSHMGTCIAMQHDQ